MKICFPLLALIVTGLLSARADLNDGLLLWYSFDQNEGGKVTDKSGHGHDARVAGPSWESAGIGGGCYHFIHSNDVIETEDKDLPMGDAPRSVSWWFSLDRLRSDQCATDIINYGTFEMTHCFALGVDWRIGRDCLAVSPWGWVALSRMRIERAGEWHHAVLTYGGNGKFSYFMDGIACKTFNEAPIAINTIAGGKFRIGAYSRETNDQYKRKVHGLDGRIDDVRVYGRELTGYETQDLFKQGASLVSKRQQTAAVAAAQSQASPSSASPPFKKESAANGTGTRIGEVTQPDLAVTRIGFSNAAGGDQDVTVFYPNENLFVTVNDVDLNPSNTNLQVRASAYQRSNQEGQSDATVLLEPQTNGVFCGALPLAKLQPGRAMIDIAAYDLGGKVMRLFRTSEIQIMKPAAAAPP